MPTRLLHPMKLTGAVNVFSLSASKLGKIDTMLSLMLTSTPSSFRAALPALLAMAIVLFHGVSAADAQKKQTQRHIFVLERLDLPKDAPPELESLVKKSFIKSVEAKPDLLSEIPETAPPVDIKDKGLHGNKPFRNFMKARKLKAYKVVVQVTEFDQPIAPNENKPGNVISCAVKLRIFGETIPGRVMAFSGDGSARVAIEVGKKIRDRDIKYAASESLDLAVEEAIKMSLKKLNAKTVVPKKKKKKKKWRKQRKKS